MKPSRDTETNQRCSSLNPAFTGMGKGAKGVTCKIVGHLDRLPGWRGFQRMKKADFGQGGQLLQRDPLPISSSLNPAFTGIGKGAKGATCKKVGTLGTLPGWRGFQRTKKADFGQECQLSERGTLPISAHWQHTFPAFDASKDGRENLNEYTAHKRQIPGAFCLPGFPLWRLGRGTFRRGRFPCKPVSHPRSSRHPTAVRSGLTAPINLRGAKTMNTPTTGEIRPNSDAASLPIKTQLEALQNALQALNRALPIGSSLWFLIGLLDHGFNVALIEADRAESLADSELKAGRG